MISRDYHPPNASKAMEIDDQKEDKLVQFEKGFEFFSRSKVSNDLTESKHSDKLQSSKNLESCIFTAKHKLTDGIER